MCVILSIDLGTSSLKAGLLDAQAGRWVDTSSRPVAMDARGDRAEQDPHVYGSALLSAVDELKNRHPDHMGRVKAVGVTGQMRTVVLMGADHEPLGPALTLYDRRGSNEADEFIQHFGLTHIHRLTGQRFDPASTPAKLRWLARHEPRRFRAARAILAPKDYLRLRLTGRYATDPTDAAGWLLYDLHAGRWQSDLVTFSGLAGGQLPDIQPACSAAGELLPELRRRWGIRGRPVVATGAGDDIAATGCGAVEPGDLYEHLGTTGSLFAVSDRIVLDGQCILECYPTERPDRFWVGGSFNAAGKAIEQGLLETVFAGDGEIDWPRVHAALRRWDEKPPHKRPLFLPYLAGERCPVWDAHIRGGMLGRFDEQCAEDLAVAIHEGPAYLLAWIAVELARLLPTQGRICSAGRGGEHEPFGRLRATIYGRPVHRTDHADAALLGAAFMAGAALGHWSSVAEGAACCLRNRWVAEPVPELTASYRQRLTAFRDSTQRLKTLP